MTDDPDNPINQFASAQFSAAVQQSMDADWAAFLQARQALAQVMSDDELSEFGFNLDELDRRP